MGEWWFTGVCQPLTFDRIGIWRRLMRLARELRFAAGGKRRNLHPTTPGPHSNNPESVTNRNEERDPFQNRLARSCEEMELIPQIRSLEPPGCRDG